MLSKAVLPDPLYAWEYLSSSLSLSLTLYVFLYSLHVYSEMFLIISLSLFLWCLDFNLRICFCWSTYTYLDIYRICLHGPLNRCLNMFSRCAPVYTCLTPIAFVPVSSCVAGGLVRQKLLKEFIEKCYQPQNAHGNTVFPLQILLIVSDLFCVVQLRSDDLVQWCCRLAWKLCSRSARWAVTGARPSRDSSGWRPTTCGRLVGRSVLGVHEVVTNFW